MPRRATVLIAALIAAVLCLGSYTFAMANAPRPAAVSATQGLGACATAAGYVRLVDGSARCPTGYTSVSLAQQTHVPRAASIIISDTGNSSPTTKTVALPGHTSVGLHCDGPAGGTFRVLIKHTGSTIKMRGEIDVATSSAQVMLHTPNSTGQLSEGHSGFGADSDIELYATVQPNTSASIDLHLQVVVAGYTYLLTAYASDYKYECDALTHVEIA